MFFFKILQEQKNLMPEPLSEAGRPAIFSAGEAGEVLGEVNFKYGLEKTPVV
jgi:hypothetical protein